MFKKLMPALSDNPFASIDEDDAPAADAPAAAEPAAEARKEPDSALYSKLFARTDEVRDPDAIFTINVMETLVLRHLDAAIKRFNVCSCDRCRCDVAAYALNHLPPRYAIATSEKLAQLEREVPLSAVTDALIKAVIQVRSTPRH